MIAYVVSMGQRQVSPLINKVKEKTKINLKKNYYKIIGLGELGNIAKYYKADPSNQK